MSGSEIIFAGIALILFLVGFLGMVLPVIPALPVIWAGVALYGLGTGFEAVDAQLILLTGVLAFIGTLADMLAQVFGAKARGATWVGMLGAVVGSILGFAILNVIGLIVGAFTGTFAGEYLKHRDREKAVRAAWGSMMGFFIGTIVKLVLAVWIIVLFFRAVF